MENNNICRNLKEINDEIYINNLQRKGENIDRLFDFSCEEIRLHKVQLIKDAQNHSLKLPCESEDQKYQRECSKEYHGIKKFPTQQKESLIQQADDIKTSRIQYAINGDILVQSIRGELQLSRNQDIYAKSCADSSDSNTASTSQSSKSAGPDSSDTSMNTRSMSSNVGSHSDEYDDDGGSNHDDDDDDDESDSERDSSDVFNLVISSQEVRKDLIGNHCRLSDPDRQYLDHFEHAYDCMARNSGHCALKTCENPAEIKKFCDNLILSSSNQHINLSKILIYHAVHCTKKAACTMPLCKFIEQILTHLDVSTHDHGSIESYLVEHSSSVKLFPTQMREGHDFHLMFTYFQGKGGFGEVTEACFLDKRNNMARVAVKELKSDPENVRMDHSISCLRKLGTFENILVPDLVLKNSEKYLLFMECGEISLLEYIKKVFDENVNSVNRCCFYFFQMAKGLTYCHDSGFVHGDIKPANAILTSGFQILKLIDWDFLKHSGDALKGTGSRGYNAPEVCKDTVVPPSDVYSLCRSLIPLLFGGEFLLQDKTCTPEEQILAHNKLLGEIYRDGTQHAATERLTAEHIQTMFREVEELQSLVQSYTPECPTVRENPVEDYDQCFKFVRNWMMGKLTSFPEMISNFQNDNVTDDESDCDEMDVDDEDDDDDDV